MIQIQENKKVGKSIDLPVSLILRLSIYVDFQ